jgi:hypothetical protein
MRGHHRRSYTHEEMIDRYELRKVEARKEIYALDQVFKPTEGAAHESWTHRYTAANDSIKDADVNIASYKARIINRDAIQILDKEIEKWKKSSTELSPSSTNKSQDSRASRYPRVSGFFSSTGSLRRAIRSSRVSKMIRLILWGVCAEVLWYLPRFLELLLKHLGAGS